MPWLTWGVMPQLLERTFAAASELPDPEQDAFASLLLAELVAEQRCSTAFAATQFPLSDLAGEALREVPGMKGGRRRYSSQTIT